MNRDFIGALLQLNAEKGVPQEILIETLEQAIESAYRRNADAPENVVVRVDPESGQISVYREYEVVATPDEVEDPELQMLVGAAQQIDPTTGVGAKVRVPENVTQAQLGRIAAQTAGQVYRQRLREAERDVVYSQYASREGEIMTGVVHRTTDQAVVLDLGKGVEAVLAVSEQLPGEHYRIGQHLKVYVLEVRRTTRGPVLVVSRTHRGFLRRVMEMEIPEIYNGTVVIRGIAREAGSRSKVAVESRQVGVDAAGGGPQRSHRRGAQDRQRGRPGAPAVAGDRQGGTERPPRRQADRLAHRYSFRRGGRHGGRRTRQRPGRRRKPRGGAGRCRSGGLSTSPSGPARSAARCTRSGP